MRPIVPGIVNAGSLGAAQFIGHVGRWNDKYMFEAWKSVTTSIYFHYPAVGEGPYEPGHVSIQRKIVRAGLAFAAIGIVPAVAFGAFGITHAENVGDLKVALSGAIFFIPPLFYFVGTSIGLLFAPNAFLRGPIGQRWLNVGGVKNIYVARFMCFFIFVMLVVIITMPFFVILRRVHSAP
jgi:hypothetical protein